MQAQTDVFADEGRMAEGLQRHRVSEERLSMMMQRNVEGHKLAERWWRGGGRRQRRDE